jgi:uncharacterized protein YecT (DUF1311 family)
MEIGNMRRKIAMLLWAICCATTPVLAEETECQLGAGNTITVGDCFEQVHNRYDVELNEIYQQVRLKLSQRSRQDPSYSKTHKQFVRSQRLWIRFRDQDCKTVARQLSQDPTLSGRNSICLIEHTEQRAKELTKWLDYLK